MLRELVVPLGTTEGRKQVLLSKFADNRMLGDAFRALLLDPAMLDPNIYGNHLVEMVAATFRGSWFVLEGAE